MSIFGTNGSDSILGTAGNDTIDGRAGSDSMLGQAGDDLIIASAADADTIDGGSGTDTARLGVSFDDFGAPSYDRNDPSLGLLLAYDFGGSVMLRNVENIVFAEGPVALTLGGSAAENVSIAGGAPTIVFAGGGNDTVVGGMGSDTLFGDLGDDSVVGGGGGDLLFALPGDNDTLDGGAGDDTIALDGDDEVAGGRFEWSGADPINTFGARWDNGAFTAIRNVEYIGDPGEDDEGLTLGTGGSDTLIARDDGEFASNVVIGGNGNDVLNGLGGTDDLVGGAGDDLLNGADGFDYASFVDASSGVVVDLAAGTASGAGADTLISIEGATGSEQNDSLSGSAVDNTLEGEGGNDTLRGLGGDDALSEGAVSTGGDDLFDGGAGFDVVDYGDVGGNLVIDLMTGSATGSGTDTLIDLEGAIGGRGDDLITGRSLGDFLFGVEGNDTLVGGDGNDTLWTGSGADSVLGGNGNDFIDVQDQNDGIVDGGAGRDQIVINEATSFLGATWDDADPAGSLALVTGPGTAVDVRNVEVVGFVSYNEDGMLATYSQFDLAFGTSVANVINASVLPGALVVAGGGGDSVTGSFLADVLLGGAGADTLLGGSGNDQIEGGVDSDLLGGADGNDTLLGGAGADQLFGAAGIDEASYADFTTGVTVSLLTSTSSDGDTLNGIENLRGGSGNDSLTGSSIANALAGGSGADSLVGDAGNDTLSGEAGADLLGGGDGNDVLRGGGGTDQLFGAAGFDEASYTDLRYGVTVSLLTNASSDGDTLSGIEALRGGAGNDSLTGSAAGNRLAGEAGADSLIGDGGNDTLLGGVGNDLLGGGNGADQLFGEAGADQLFGAAGNDSLTGGDGDDTLSGGAGADAFRFTTALPGAGADRITDFNPVDDILALENAFFTGLAAGALAAGAFHIGAAAADALDRVIYNGATGALFFDADGSGAGAAIQFATLNAGLALTAADVWVI